jgi:hypothetical protein
MRVYDPRAGRFLSVDPLAKKYPELNAYQFSCDRPVDGIDQDGAEWKKIVSCDPQTGVTNIHFQVKLSLVNDSKVFKDVKSLIPELQRQFESTIESANTSKIRYSISLNATEDKNPGRYSAILYDREKGNMIGGIDGNSTNTQDNIVSASAANDVEFDKPGTGKPRELIRIAQTIVHELLHTANLRHTQDPDNNAKDVDLRPEYKIDANGKKVFSTFVPSDGANLNLILHNIVTYGIIFVNGKTVGEQVPDVKKCGDISPDQVKIITEQIDRDTKNKK